MKRLLVAFLALSAGSLWAQSGEFWFNAGESLLSAGIGSPLINGSQNDLKLDSGFRFGFRFAFNNGGHIGHELQYAYSRTHLVDETGALFGTVGASEGMGIHTGGYNFLYYATKEGSRIRPFATGGLHFSNYVPPGSSATSGGGSTKFGINYGAGVKVNVTSLFGVRFDVREYENPKPDFGFSPSGWLHQTEISAGVGVHF